MSGRLTAYDIRLMLIELDIAEKYRESPRTHAASIGAVRGMLLRAALVDVPVEAEVKP